MLHLGADQVVFKDDLYLGVYGRLGGLNFSWKSEGDQFRLIFSR